MKLYSKPYFKILLFGVLFSTDAGAVVYPLTPLSELGVKLTKSKIGSSETFEFFDTKSKHTIIYVYGFGHMLESFEIRDALGKSLEKTRYLPNRVWKQTPTKLDEWITSSSSKSFHRVTEFTGKKRVLEYPYSEDMEYSCSEDDDKDKDLKQVAQLEKDLDPQVSVLLGNAKVKSTGCETYPDGELGLVKEMQSALKKGTKCLTGKSMEGINSPESRDQGLALRAILENPETTMTLKCVKQDEKFKVGDREVTLTDRTFARAWIPPKSGAPGIFINLDNLGKLSESDRQGMLFHEMLHWLGILHNENFDTPYIATQCCLADDPDAPKAKKACDLLNTSPRPEVDSKKYLNDFTELMLLNRNPLIPLRTAQRSAGRKLKDKPIDLSNQFEATLQVKKSGYSSAAVYAHALEKMDPNLKEPLDPDAADKPSTPGFDQAVALTGDFVAAEQTRNGTQTYEDRVKNFAQLKSEYQDLLDKTTSPVEKERIMRGIEQWTETFSTMSTQYGGSDDENAKMVALWKDVKNTYGYSSLKKNSITH